MSIGCRLMGSYTTSLTHCMCVVQESRPTWGDGQWSGRLRAKMLGDALLSMRMMSNGCRLISSYSLTHCMLAVQESKKAGPPLMKEEARSIAPNPAGAPYTSYTSNILVLNCPPRISPQSLLACMLGEMNWPTNVTPNSLCLYAGSPCVLGSHSKLSWHAWCEKGPLMKKEAWSSFRSIKHHEPNPAEVSYISYTSSILLVLNW